MLPVLSLIAGAGASVSLPVRLPDEAGWTLTAQYEREEEGERAASSFAVEFEKRIHRSAGGRLRVSPVAARTLSGPPDAAAAQQLDVPLVVEVNPSLFPLRIENLAPARAAMERLLRARSPPGKTPPPMPQAIIDQAALALGTRELAILARGQGLSLPLDGPRVVERMVTLPLVEVQVPVREAVEVEAYEPSKGRAVFTWRLTLTEAGKRQAIRALIERSASLLSLPPPGPALDTALAGMTFDYAEECRYLVDPATGLVTWADCVKGVGVDAAGRFKQVRESWTIVQSAPSTP